MAASPFAFGTTSQTLPSTPPAVPPPAPFAFGASGSPTAPAASATPTGGFDMNAFMSMVFQHMQNQDQQDAQHLGMQKDALQQRGQLQNNAIFGRHLGIQGDDIGSTSHDPWGPSGLFHGGFASTMSPESIAASRGNDAQNQWNNPKMFPGNAWRGAPPNDQIGQVVSPGIGGFSARGEQQFQGPAGLSTQYIPSQDTLGAAGIRKRYDPAYAGDPQFRGARPPSRGIPRMF